MQLPESTDLNDGVNITFCICRFNIAADLVDEAKNAGQLGFAGILVWMRFMATRQLVWNKSYNVKPRYSSNNVILILPIIISYGRLLTCSHICK